MYTVCDVSLGRESQVRTGPTERGWYPEPRTAEVLEQKETDEKQSHCWANPPSGLLERLGIPHLIPGHRCSLARGDPPPPPRAHSSDRDGVGQSRRQAVVEVPVGDHR